MTVTVLEVIRRSAEYLESNEFERLLELVRQLTGERLTRHGLSGDQLQMKREMVRVRERRFFERPGARMFRRFVQAIDVVLESILSATGAGTAGRLPAFQPAQLVAAPIAKPVPHSSALGALPIALSTGISSSDRDSRPIASICATMNPPATRNGRALSRNRHHSSATITNSAAMPHWIACMIR